MAQPLVSICIPTFGEPVLVKRLLKSIEQQSFTNIEVIIADDSPGEDIKIAIKEFDERLHLVYLRNKPPLRTPANWNFALENGKGKYKILMHHDDWFSSELAIASFVDELEASNADWVFGRSMALDPSIRSSVRARHFRLVNNIKKEYMRLLTMNVIGPPSNVMIRGDCRQSYDEKFVWLVDVDYYISLFHQGLSYSFINEKLVNVGIHEGQTSVFVNQNPGVILKENILFSAKMNHNDFRDLVIYDHFWRLLRNHRVRSFQTISSMSVNIPSDIKQMVKWQRVFPSRILHIGVFSRIIMGMCYLFNKHWKVSQQGQ